MTAARVEGPPRADIYNTEKRKEILEKLGRELQRVTRAHAERGE